MKRDFLVLSDLGEGGIERILGRARELEKLRHTPEHPRPLTGHSVALLFDKPSTRTLLSLDVAVHELGGHPVLLTPSVSQVMRGEPPEDTARVLGRLVSLVAHRGGSAEVQRTIARACRAPILNALTDDAHPLQVLADLHTVHAAFGRLEGLRIGWVGDATNVARSWIEAAGLLGLEFVVACPEEFAPPHEEIELANRRGGRVRTSADARDAARGADVLITDVWVSMGFEEETARRKQTLVPYRLTRELVSMASENVVVLHCLPAHRGEEIDADVLDGPRSHVWEAVSARLPTTKAVLEWAHACAKGTPSARTSAG